MRPFVITRLPRRGNFCTIFPSVPTPRQEMQDSGRSICGNSCRGLPRLRVGGSQSRAVGGLLLDGFEDDGRAAFVWTDDDGAQEGVGDGTVLAQFGGKENAYVLQLRICKWLKYRVLRKRTPENVCKTYAFCS